MRSFSTGIIIRIIIIVVLSLIGAWSWYHNNTGIVILMIGLMVISVFNLFRYTTTLNKKLIRFFDSIQYEDFAITFRADNKKGRSFEDLNNSLNAVIKSFNQVRAEREATLHFIQAIIQQISVGILSYTRDGKIEIINHAAGKLLGIYKLNNIASVKVQYPDMYNLVTTLPTGESKLIKHNGQEISVSVKEIMLRDRKIRLIALHNIRSELQSRELEAWQNLTKVLRHEIMNTVTPIVSLSETMKEIIETDLSDVSTHGQKEGVKDLKNAITTVINRSKGIMNFVNAYREFTNIPIPAFTEMQASAIFEDLRSIYHDGQVWFVLEHDFKFMGDVDQIGQVLINLIKNALEATINIKNGTVIVRSSIKNQEKIIEIIDNGTGVKQEDTDKIFVPFFTTKPTGTGIGLSLSRQIIQMHGGRLEYEPLSPAGSRFYLLL